jgi:chemotaxis regulatin CheY-phosphate phosphatase CheZ
MSAWSVEGKTRSTFEIVRVEAKQLIVKPSSGKLRSIPENEFKRVFDRWQDYLSRRLPRHEVRNLTQNSTYIITILHQLETLP